MLEGTLWNGNFGRAISLGSVHQLLRCEDEVNELHTREVSGLTIGTFETLKTFVTNYWDW
jgi:hypothetical protein